MTDPPTRLVSRTRVRDPLGTKGACDALVFTPEKYFPVDMLMEAFQQSVLNTRGILRTYGATPEGNLLVVVTDIDEVRQLLIETSQLPSILRALEKGTS